MKRLAAWALIGCLMLSLTACSKTEAAVYVQSVADLTQMGGIAPTDKFSGIVVSENVTEITKDDDKTIEELFVHEGQDVREGQKLFAYDTEQLQLTLEKQQLQLQQLESSIVSYGEQIAQLEKDRERASTKDKLQYTVQIQTNQIDLKEAELNLKTKQSEVKKSEYLLANALVVSPVTGRITAISESGTDDRGNAKPYITIQKAGSYRVKGTLNEMQRGAIFEGSRILIESRLDPDAVWMGTVTLVDYDNPVQGNNNNYYAGGSDEMGNTSRYPFYVELDSSEGMLLGQHLYLSIAIEEEESEDAEGLSIGSSLLAYDDEGNAFIWADHNGKLEKRMVELGEYNFMKDTYPILSGLTEEDYVAFPDEEVCKEGAPTTKTQREGGVK